MTIDHPLEGLPAQELVRIDGYEVHSDTGDKIGYVDLIFVDHATGTPEWLGVWRDGPGGGRRTIMPVRRARQVGGEVHVPWTTELVERAPAYHEGLLHDKPKDVHITSDMEEAAYALYGVEPITAPPADVAEHRIRPAGSSREG